MHRMTYSINQILTLLFICPMLVFAQKNNFHFKTLTTTDGLSQNYVFTILQDQKGFMWFGTWNGLNKYNGYQFKTYKSVPYSPNSLSNSCITTLFEDHKGNLWIGTNDGGLNRLTYSFEPDQFQTKSIKEPQFYQYQSQQEDSLNIIGKNITAITEDQYGNIWIGTYNNGLNVIYRDSAEPAITYNYDQTSPKAEGLPIKSINCIHRDQEGFLWIGTRTQGLIKVHPANQPKEDIFTVYQAQPDSPDGLKSNNISAVLEDHTGSIWIGTQGDGLFKMLSPQKTAANKPSFIHYSNNPANPQSLINNNIEVLYQDRYKRIWVGTSNGISLIKSAYVKNTPQKIPFKRIKANNETSSPGLTDNHIKSIYEDRYGMLWIGTYSGVNKLNLMPKKFHTYTGKKSDPIKLVDQRISTIHQDPKGNLWIGSESGIINKYSISQKTTDHYFVTREQIIQVRPYMKSFRFESPRQYQAPASISANTAEGNMLNIITAGADNHLWIGGIGLYHYNYDQKTFNKFRFDKNSSPHLSDKIIWDIYSDQQGNSWVASSDGLYIHHQKSGKLIALKHKNTDSSSLSSNTIRDLQQDERGNMWIGTNNGLNCIPGRQVQNITPQAPSAQCIHFMHNPENQETISSNKIRVIHETPKGKLFVGTEGGGLNKINFQNKAPHKISQNNIFFTHYGEKEGLGSNIICGILSDNKGNIWISTTKGLSKFNVSQETFTTFNQNDGLQGNEFNKGAYFKNHKGKMFFGGINGLTTFYPDSIHNNPHPPQVAITKLKISNKEVPVGKFQNNRNILTQPIHETQEIELSHQDNVITFQFVALHYLTPHENKYAYKLQGIEEQWNKTNHRNRQATYTNLSPGHYTFLVKAANSDGIWNKTPVSVRITIHPPLWQTWWAYILYVLILGTTLYGIWRYTLSKERLKSNLKLARLEANQQEEMARKNNEINQMKLRFFTNISHEFRTPLTLITGPIEDLRNSISKDSPMRQKIDFIYRNTQQLLHLVNQLMDFRKLELGNTEVKAEPIPLHQFLGQMISAFQYLADQQQITLSYTLPEEDIHIWVDRDMMEKVLNNLLSNAFKFTEKNSKIEVIAQKRTTDDQLIQSAFEKPDTFKHQFISIEVKDYGKGMHKTQLDKIFNRYYQVNRENTQKYQGTGIGLAITKQFTELHHGTIDVQSEEGKGSSFTVIIPLGNDHFTEDQLKDENLKEEQTLEEPIQCQPLTEDMDQEEQELMKTEKAPLLLIVEDNYDLRSYVKSALEQDYRIKEATNGREGWHTATEEIPDLIITDIMMDDMDGLELSQHLKNDQRTSHIPIIVLTALSSEETKIEGFDKGVDEYLTKPFSTSVLQARINNLITSRQNLKQHFSTLMLHSSPKESSISSKDQDFLEQANTIIENNIDNNQFSVEKLASELALSRTQLYRKIKGVTGQSVTEFVRTVKLKKAAEYLSQGNYTVNEITHKIGFNSQSYFTRCFHEVYGVSPHDYEDKTNNSENPH